MHVPKLPKLAPTKPGITFGIITYNEEEYIKRCIDSIRASDYTKDATIIVVDGKSTDNTRKICEDLGIKDLYVSEFAGHYANQKNLLMQACITPWMFSVDADEILTVELLDKLEALMSGGHDAYEFPRKNIIDGKDTGVYPDYQVRLFRTFCRYIYPVHEEVAGYRNLRTCKLDIIHDKKQDRHDARNKFYDEIEVRWSNELRNIEEE